MKQVICNKDEYVKVGLEELVKKIDPEPRFQQQMSHFLQFAVQGTSLLLGIRNKMASWGLKQERKVLEDKNCFRAGICTNACNVGIDDERINYCVRFGLPRDLNTFFQERGRGSRRRGSPSTFV